MVSMVRGLKNIILILIVCLFVGQMVFAGDISVGIEAYQNGKYEDCITAMKSIIKSDPTDALAYYYLAIAYAKTGKEVLAVENYNKVINLSSDKTLTSLAKQGKSQIGVKKVNVIEKQLHEIEDEYNPILNDVASGVNDKSKDIKDNPSKKNVTRNNEPAKFEFDPNREPTNDEIVNAIKILQKAGLLQNGAAAITGGNNQNQYQQMPYQQMPQLDSRTQQMYSMMQMMNSGNNNNSMMNMMPYMQNGGKVDPQMIKMMMMQQMMPNFSNNNNNGY